MSEDHDIDRYFTDEHLVDRPPDVRLSPSGRFRLEVRRYTTRPGCWSYSRGTVVRVADEEIVADVRRNYSAFHCTFVARGGHEYLIAGRSYMGQTIVDLETGEEWNDPRWPGGYEGDEFCWAACQLSPDGRTLLVDGCHWACPYEYRFYDFEDPSRGWSELPVRDGDGEPVWLEADDGEAPRMHADGRIECFETARLFVPQQRRGYEISKSEREGIDPRQWEDAASWDVVVDRRVVLRREGDHMLVVEDWCSPAYLRQQGIQQERAAAEDAMHEAWMARCTVLTPAREALRHHYLEHQLWITTPKEASVATGGVLSLHVTTGKKGTTARMCFGVDHGPVTVELRRHPGVTQRREFSREAGALLEAAAAIKRFIEG